MEYIKELTILYLKKKIILIDYYTKIDQLFLENKIDIETLAEIKNYFLKINKIELLDDYLIRYVIYNNLNYSEIKKILSDLEITFTRNLFIKLVSNGIVTDEDNCLLSENEKKYYNILKTDLDPNVINELIKYSKYYRNVSSETNNYTDYFIHIINTIPVLDEYEELMLFKSYKNGNLKAYERILVSNIRLVIAVALKKYSDIKDKYELDDIIENGIIGLINAINSYDYESGNKFSTFAVIAISNKIKRELCYDRTIAIPADIDFSKEINRPKELIDKLNNVNDIVSLNSSLDAADEDSEDKLIDTISYEEELSVEDEAILNMMIADVDNEIFNSSMLNKVEKELLLFYYFNNYSQKEIANLMLCTHQAISQKKNSIEKKLKKSQDFQKLHEYIK